MTARTHSSRDTLRALFVGLPTPELVLYADRNSVTVARAAGGEVNRFATIERLVDSLAPLPELHGP